MKVICIRAIESVQLECDQPRMYYCYKRSYFKELSLGLLWDYFVTRSESMPADQFYDTPGVTMSKHIFHQHFRIVEP